MLAAEILPIIIGLSIVVALVGGFFALLNSGERARHKRLIESCTEIGVIMDTETRYMNSLNQCFMKKDGKFVPVPKNRSGYPQVPGESE